MRLRMVARAGHWSARPDAGTGSSGVIGSVFVKHDWSRRGSSYTAGRPGTPGRCPAHRSLRAPYDPASTRITSMPSRSPSEIPTATMFKCAPEALRRATCDSDSPRPCGRACQRDTLDHPCTVASAPAIRLMASGRPGGPDMRAWGCAGPAGDGGHRRVGCQDDLTRPRPDPAWREIRAARPPAGYGGARPAAMDHRPARDGGNARQRRLVQAARLPPGAARPEHVPDADDPLAQPSTRRPGSPPRRRGPGRGHRADAQVARARQLGCTPRRPR